MFLARESGPAVWLKSPFVFRSTGIKSLQGAVYESERDIFKQKKYCHRNHNIIETMASTSQFTLLTLLQNHDGVIPLSPLPLQVPKLAGSYA